MDSACEEVLDVLVLGSGWSGLMTCKYALEERLNVRVLEKRDDIGGVWKYSDDPSLTTVMKSSSTSSSSTLTEISDFPMPEEIGEFPKHWDIYNYLNNYADKHSLRQHIRFNCSVKSMSKSGNVWDVLTNLDTKYRARNVVICTGVHEKANRSMEQAYFKNYTGELLHSGNIKSFIEGHKEKRIMVVGGGETASDILDEYYGNVARIIWCIPRGQHFFRKYAKILPHRKPQALDKASSRALKLIAPHVKSKPGLAWVCKWTTNGSLTAYQGHGIPEFRNDASFLHAFINKHAHALDYIDYENVIPKGAIEFAKEKKVYFQDGSSCEIDVIIQCTGYDATFPFLPPAYNKMVLTDLYKFVYPVLDPSLAFVGYVRPIVGSIPGIAEMQARWVCRVISGRVDLPSSNERTKVFKKDQLFWSGYFKNTSRRIGTLVEGYTYLDQIAKLSNCYPDYWALFKNNPKAWFTAYFAPYNGCSFLLNDSNKRDESIETLSRHSRDTITAFNLITIILCRLFMFDWFCDVLGTIKYQIQINKMWHKMRTWKIIRLLDYAWCTPKRYLFDNKTRT
ncbi:dimethylaniline monooxygenase [N-oxide-forming] 2-like [Hydractinia symbiolongicarpus]|uniref:dimethylaniline monooxygenase [N-oxide-forming] 2-like n=1 Tax=Hydractinia symbiolongicarpus TaxID=13093 RepID=UPI00254BBCBD|nr:dimethylaniline monooxygenase [N-oxide-forming] 2-like [Hydractinia symbiolongicarpus]